MAADEKVILVFGATGQQGGAVADALLLAGWAVRALVRDPEGVKARELARRGVATVRGDFRDALSLQAAMDGVHGVFSVQPSSGQGVAYGVTDADEVRYGSQVVDEAARAGVRHLVYSSVNAAGDLPTGMGHFDSKSAVERHVRASGLAHTVLRPSAFMEILTLPGLGLDSGTITFFMRPDQPMQFIAAADIGRFAAAAFADPEHFASRTIEIAGDAVTGTRLAETFGRAAGRPIAYRRFADDLLAGNGFLGGLTDLVDDGRLAGRADLPALRSIVPGLLTLDDWLAGPGGPLLRAALAADKGEVALR